MSKIHRLAKHGKIEELEHLLDEGLSGINSVNKMGETALTLAAERGHAEVVYTLLERGANINKSDPYFNTPILLAVKYGYYITFKTLLRNKPDINRTNSKQTSPFFWACKLKDEKFALELIKYDPKLKLPMVLEALNVHPLHLASANGHLKVMEYLIEDRNVHKDWPRVAGENIGQTPLYWATTNRQYEAMKYLMGKGCNPKGVEDSEPKNTPIGWAQAKGDKKALKILKGK